MVYLYAISESSDVEHIERRGVDGRMVTAEPCCGLLAVVSDVDQSPEATPEEMWNHEDVVEALMARATIVPARFGTVFESLDRVRSAVDRQRPTLLREIESLRGLVELGVRVVVDDPEWMETAPRADPPRSGRDYMLNKLEHARRNRELTTKVGSAVHDLHATLNEWAIKSTGMERRSRSQFAASYLVEKNCANNFVERATKMKPRFLKDPVITGPWPPYSFVTPLQEHRDG